MTNEYRKQQVTLPPLSFKDREIAYVQILTPMHRSERVDEADDNRQAATTCRVKNLRDGMDYIMVCPTLMVSSIQDIGMEYVGKAFEVIVTRQPLPGKRYKGVEVYEIDPEADYTKMPEHLADDSKADK